MRFGRRAVAAAIAAATALALVGCVGAGNPSISPTFAKSPGSSGTVGAPSTLTQRLDALRQRLDPLIDRSAAGVQSSAGARPTVVERDGQGVAMTIRDVSDAGYPAGRYQLVIYCLGSGTLYTHFSIGGSSSFKELPACRPDGPTVTPVSLTVAKRADRMVVGIVPAGVTEAAVGYIVRKL